MRGGNNVEALQKYELIRPILMGEKTPKQVHEETQVALSAIYRYLKRFQEYGFEGLHDRSHAIHSHPHWLTQEERDQVADYKRRHPHLSTRQIAQALAQEGILEIHDRTIANILQEYRLSPPFLATSRPS